MQHSSLQGVGNDLGLEQPLQAVAWLASQVRSLAVQLQQHLQSMLQLCAGHTVIAAQTLQHFCTCYLQSLQQAHNTMSALSAKAVFADEALQLQQCAMMPEQGSLPCRQQLGGRAWRCGARPHLIHDVLQGFPLHGMSEWGVSLGLYGVAGLLVGGHDLVEVAGTAVGLYAGPQPQH